MCPPFVQNCADRPQHLAAGAPSQMAGSRTALRSALDSAAHFAITVEGEEDSQGNVRRAAKRYEYTDSGALSGSRRTS